MTEPHWLTAAEAGRAFAARSLSPVELLTDLLARIERLDTRLHAFIRLDADAAMDAGRAAEREIAAGRVRGPLHGIPIGIKDIIDVAGLPTTCHSKLLLDNVAKADAAVVAKLRGAGAVILGKLATHEFAIGGPSFDLPFPPARNPWNPEHHPGGSSSGLRRRGGGRAVPAGTRHRHRRLRAQPGKLLRHRRAEADLRAGLAARRVPAGFHPRPCRSAGPHGGGLRAGARRRCRP